MIFKPYLQLMVDKRASDLYISAGSLPQIRIEGRMVQIGKTPLSASTVNDGILEIMNEREKTRFERSWEVDFSFEVGEIGRFRVAAFRQRGQTALVVRFVHPALPQIRELGLPLILQDLAIHRSGLILVVGPTGCGKSTTMAAMMQHRNESMSGHILTIEDPIEFHLQSKLSIVNQRELGVDTASYAAALHSALRASPDVVMVGEVRDRVTMQAVMELSGTGHLCMATMHANNAPQALDRISSLFPPDHHKQLFLDLSLYLRAVVSQRLVTNKEGRRLAAVEIMINTPYVAELVSLGNFGKLKAVMEESKAQGMQDIDTVLHEMYLEGSISKEEVLANADSRANLEAKINFQG